MAKLDEALYEILEDFKYEHINSDEAIEKIKQAIAYHNEQPDKNDPITTGS